MSCSAGSGAARYVLGDAVALAEVGARVFDLPGVVRGRAEPAAETGFAFLPQPRQAPLQLLAVVGALHIRRRFQPASGSTDVCPRHSATIRMMRSSS